MLAELEPESCLTAAALPRNHSVAFLVMSSKSIDCKATIPPLLLPQVPDQASKTARNVPTPGGPKLPFFKDVTPPRAAPERRTGGKDIKSHDLSLRRRTPPRAALEQPLESRDATPETVRPRTGAKPVTPVMTPRGAHYGLAPLPKAAAAGSRPVAAKVDTGNAAITIDGKSQGLRGLWCTWLADEAAGTGVLRASFRT